MMENSSKSLAPSKSTVYVSNFSYSLTNNDIHKVLEKVGRIVKVTIVKDRVTRTSKGIAFVLFLERESALKCVEQFNNTEIFGRRISCSVANDNGRAAEFIRKRKYPDKSRCYECGEPEHLSYACPKNLLGKREPPKAKKRKIKPSSNTDLHSHCNRKTTQSDDEYDSDEVIDKVPSNCNPSSEESEVEDESLSEAIKFQQSKVDEDDYRLKVASGDYGHSSTGHFIKKPRIIKDSYFSDEEEVISE